MRTEAIALFVAVVFSAGVFAQEHEQSPPVLSEVETLRLQLHLAHVRIADLTAALSPYQVRWKIVDGGGLVAFAPNGQAADVWIVVSP